MIQQRKKKRKIVKVWRGEVLDTKLIKKAYIPFEEKDETLNDYKLFELFKAFLNLSMFI